jgi:hypothetical protein
MLAKAKMMLNKLNATAANSQLIFFSDEDNFSLDQKIPGKK